METTACLQATIKALADTVDKQQGELKLLRPLLKPAQRLAALARDWRVPYPPVQYRAAMAALAKAANAEEGK